MSALKFPSEDSVVSLHESSLNKKESYSNNDFPTQKFSYGGGRFEILNRGVCFVSVDKDGNEQDPQWICSPLYVVAKVRNDKSEAWGRWLEWFDDDGIKHCWSMPMALLQGDGRELRSELAQLGLSISPSKNSRDLLMAYLQACPTDKRVRGVDKLGWHGDVYVTTDGTFGSSEDKVVFQSSYAVESAISSFDTLEKWRETVGRMSAGNSRLVFAISASFAGVLLELSGLDSGGFHFRGPSSTGKTTIIKAASSVWGIPKKHTRQWRATVNGLEGLAAHHNDNVLILDDIDQANEKDVGDSVYLLANGQGKSRAFKNGAARKGISWRLLFISSGEHSLAAILSRADKRATAGQEIRLADIEADAGAGMGVFEELHGIEAASLFADAINAATSKCYGTPGSYWLSVIANFRSTSRGCNLLIERIENDISEFVSQVVPPGSHGQISRVAKRFALVAAAGELASEHEITGWPAGEAKQAAKACFVAWLHGFGLGNQEQKKLLSQVRAFFEKHGAGRFENKDANTDDQKILNRAGFYRADDRGRKDYFVLPEIFKNEVCAGFDHRLAAKILVDEAWIIPSGDKQPRATQKLRLPGMDSTRCYVFTSAMWGHDI